MLLSMSLSPVMSPTGCGSEIGREKAIDYARKGYKVALVDFSIQQTESVARECQEESPKNRIVSEGKSNLVIWKQEQRERGKSNNLRQGIQLGTILTRHLALFSPYSHRKHDSESDD